MVDEKILSVLRCALNTTRDPHICEQPIDLDCGHHACKCCLPKNKINKIIECKICHQLNKIELNQTFSDSKSFDFLLEKHLTEIFEMLYEEFSEKLSHCRNMVSNNKEVFDLKIEYAKEQVEIRVESIKIELEKLSNFLIDQLDRLKVDWTSEAIVVFNRRFDMQKLESELKNLNNDITNKANATQEKLYKYQKDVEELKKCIKKYENTIPDIEFCVSKTEIENNLIGEIRCEYKDDENIHKQLIKRIKEKKYENFDLLGKIPYDICLLPNAHLLVSDYTFGKLSLYDTSLQLIKDVDLINGKQYNIIGLDTDKQSSIYFCAHMQHAIIKTDLEFNELALFGGDKAGSGNSYVNNPYGLCCNNGSIFVCDYNNKRIVKLSEDLVFEEAYSVEYNPWYIKIVDNVACIRSDSLVKFIHFYDVTNFLKIRKYDGHNGVIGASSLYFYEYSDEINTLFCYNNKGELIEQVETDFNEKSYFSSGTICLFNSNMLICNSKADVIRI